MEFANPHILWLLAAIVPLAGYYVWRTMQGDATIRISSVEGLRHAPRTVRYYLRHVPFALRCRVPNTIRVPMPKVSTSCWR